ncbi:unnamed protein product [Cyclocybe aegerita]|uniref:F-box domain-containing protein n=1 Tax=Cyclocybe aegerita TaxID=1973307 RepID=A0A8S0XNQ5_CYCAE|nr:unnamed protein product [Cyclocybe aegerita]
MNANVKNDSNETFPPSFVDWNQRALPVTCTTSHVCRAWRAVILASPALWGGLVDLNVLQYISEDGVQEIMKRTGTAPLSVQGTIRSARSRKFIVSLINTDWSRIRVFDVAIRDSLVCSPSKTDWKVLFTSAKSLEYFNFSLVDGDWGFDGVAFRDTESAPALFGNDAPQLRGMKSRRLLQINLWSPWVSQLTHLHVEGSGAYEITISEWLHALGNMGSRLQTLAISWIRNPSPSEQLPTVQMPSLTDIKLECSPIFAASFFLDHLFPSPGCNINMIMFSPKASMQPDHISLATRVLSRYAGSWLVHYKPNPWPLYIDFTTEYFRVEREAQPIGTRYPSMAVHVANGRNQSRDWSHALFLLSILSSCNLTDAVRVGLSFKNSVHNHPDVQGLLRALSTVEVLRIKGHQTLLGFVPQADTPTDAMAGTPIFPNLSRVRIESHSFSDQESQVPGDKDAERSYELFFKWRSCIGSPVSVLDLTQCQERIPLTKLDGLSGLTIRWHDESGIPQEYVCGSGNPDLLANWGNETA